MKKKNTPTVFLEINGFDALKPEFRKPGTVLEVVYSMKEGRPGTRYIINSRKKCTHPEKNEYDIMPSSWFSLCSGFGDVYKPVSDTDMKFFK